MEEKTGLRKQMLAERDGLEHAAKTAYDYAICEKLAAIIVRKDPKVVHAYIPMGSEVNILPLLEQLLDNGITVVTPKALKGRKMRNLALHSITELEEGIFGTMHPAHDNEYTGNIDLYVIPGLAFDKMNHRIGYGAGYYDSFLSSHAGYKVGVCYPFQVVEKLPAEEHDVAMDEIVF